MLLIKSALLRREGRGGFFGEGLEGGGGGGEGRGGGEGGTSGASQRGSEGGIHVRRMQKKTGPMGWAVPA